MNEAEIDEIRKDIETTFPGLRFGKVFQLGRYSLAIDLYPHNGSYLFVDVDPKVRQVFLIKRRLKELERSATHPAPFVIQIRKMLSGRELMSVSRPPGSRVLRLGLLGETSEETKDELNLIIQLGGRRPNLFIIGANEQIIAALSESKEPGQSVGDIYGAPIDSTDGHVVTPDMNGGTLSEKLDAQYRAGHAENQFAEHANIARKKINGEIAKRRKLIRNLEGDLADHGNADEWKRLGDLLLANLSNLRRQDDKVIVKDYFDPDLAEIEIDVDKNQSPTEAAEEYFKRYTKARNGAAAISIRLKAVTQEIEDLEKQRTSLETAIEAQDELALSEFLPRKQPLPVQGKRKLPTDDFKGAREFVSSDGFEILVGKKAKDNDYLTFRIAKSLDLWLHAADYPGSHVVVRNPNRKEIPTRTLIEAAQLAAFYSDARDKPKAAVNYTQKKFVNKPKRSAPGLVSLASFKTILVEPKVAIGPVTRP